MSAVYADLHMHTTHSDGVLTPEELVEEAIIRKLSVIAITDHDCLSAIDEATHHAGNRLKIIPSLELSCRQGGEDVHVLGHFVDHKNINFLNKVNFYKEKRQDRAKEFVKNLNEKLNLTISYEKIRQDAGDGAIGRPHIARELLRLGYVQTTQEAFKHLLSNHSPAYIPKFEVTLKEGIELIHSAGGIAIWAHPHYNNLDHNLEEFIDSGLDGLEVFHPAHNRSVMSRYRNLAHRNNLLVSGGSDFHGPGGKADLGEMGLTKKQFEALC